MLSVFPGPDFSVCIVFVYFHCLHNYLFLVLWKQNLPINWLQAENSLILQSSQRFWVEQSQTFVFLMCLPRYKCVCQANINFKSSKAKLLRSLWQQVYHNCHTCETKVKKYSASFSLIFHDGYHIDIKQQYCLIWGIEDIHQGTTQ